MRTRRTVLVGASALLAALTLLSGSPAAQAATRAPSPPPARSAAVAAAASADTAPAAGPICWYGACYDYVSGQQLTDTAGASVRMLQADPEIKPGDTNSHSLQELALQSADHNSTVEIGWTVDLGLNGDTRPHLFVYHWVNGAESCYNACGFVQVSRTVKPGMAVRAGTAAKFTIENRAGDWWSSRRRPSATSPARSGPAPTPAPRSSPPSARSPTRPAPPARTWATAARAAPRAPAGSPTSAARIQGPPGADGHRHQPALYSAGRTTRTSFHLGGPGSGSC